MLIHSISKYIFEFNIPAGTSRGILTEKTSFFIELFFSNNPNIKGLGEVSIIKDLSPDYISDENHLKMIDFYCNEIKNLDFNNKNNREILEELNNLKYITKYPSILFGIETAILDLQNGGKKIYFENNFSKNKTKIPINGLIWMGNEEFMWKQIQEKISQSYNCIKLKIGSLDFKKECQILKKIRENFGNQIIIRLDANGAFEFKDSLEKLNILSKFNIHSIEQPIKKGNWNEMELIVKKSPIPIALDEELIGIFEEKDKIDLLKKIKPSFLVLKPSLHGGINGCRKWIEIAEKENISWWITSALESNIGLNAICQFTAEYNINLHQGLGTGKIYKNNFESKLHLKQGSIFLS